MSLPSQQHLVQRVVGWLADYFAWVKETLASDTARRAVLADLGLDPENLPPEPVPGERVTSIDRYRNRVDADEQAFLAVWQDILVIVESIDGFVAAAGADAGGRAFVKETVRQFLSLTGTEYVRLRHPKTYFVARLLAVIEDTVPEQFHAPVDTVVTKDVFANLLELLEAPIDHFDRVYSRPETEADARRLAANTLVPIAMLLAFWDRALAFIGAEYELPERHVLHGWDTPPDSPTPLADRISAQMLSFAFDGITLVGGGDDPGVSGTTGATLAWIPSEHGGPGLYVSIHGAADLDVPLGSLWKWNTKRPTATVLDALVWDSVDFRPAGESPPGNGEPETEDPGSARAAAGDVGRFADPAALPEADDEVRFTIEPVEATPTDPYVLTVFGTRIEIGRLSITLRIAGDGVEVKLVARDSALVVRTDDGDGLVAKLLPPSGARLEFDLGIGLVLSPELRVHLEGGSGLQATLPLNRSLGPARLQQLYLALASGTKTTDRLVHFESSLAASIGLGPITATVDRVGFELVVDSDGGTPPTVGFKHPSGIGLVIDAAVVSGGGYLFHDPATGQYSGVVQLDFRGLTLHAIGLITTRLPSGRRGFSLVIIVAASDFAPIDLGFGFRLAGVGGLVGYNRTIDVAPLRAGLKTGALDNVLFPPHPVRDAPRIVAALEAIMPPRDDQFLIGPMARVVWGVPTLLTIDLGIVIEMPSPTRLVVLGQFRAVLPSDEKPLVRLQMDALGVVDFDRGDVAVDAVLYDSRITRYAITGAMALRARWETDPAFALAVGGLHPQFDPPAGFPKLARVTVGLNKSDSTRLTLQAYLALTSNTVQVGARLDVFVKASGFSVEGGLGFDALFQFSPFAFVVELHAGVTLKWHGRTLLGVDLDLTLSGPSPWHARGKATFKIWRFSKSISFDRTLGSDTPPPALPAADPLPELVAALADPRNWSARPPAAMLVTLRDTGPTTDVVVHPLGELSVRQRVVPLGVEIDRFGNTTPSGDRRFDVVVLGDGGAPATGTAPVTEYFAPAQFITMSDSEKLQRPSFELMGAGVRIGDTALTWGGRDDPALVADAELTYETIVVGAPDGPRRDHPDFGVDDLRLAAAIGAVGRSPRRRTGPARYRAPGHELRLASVGYTIVSTTDLSPVAVDGLRDATASYTVAAQALARHLASHPEQRGRLQVAEDRLAGVGT